MAQSRRYAGERFSQEHEDSRRRGAREFTAHRAASCEQALNSFQFRVSSFGFLARMWLLETRNSDQGALPCLSLQRYWCRLISLPARSTRCEWPLVWLVLTATSRSCTRSTSSS